jgi:hypothetical protein
MRKLIALAIAALLVGTAAPALAYGPGVVAAGAVYNRAATGLTSAPLDEESLLAYEGSGLPAAVVYWGGRALLGGVTGLVVEYIQTGNVSWRGFAAGVAAGISGSIATKYLPPPR